MTKEEGNRIIDTQGVISGGDTAHDEIDVSLHRTIIKTATSLKNHGIMLRVVHGDF